MLRDRVVLAIEATHASGKTTLTHALAAYYREHGIHVATVEGPARHSPSIEEITIPTGPVISPANWTRRLRR